MRVAMVAVAACGGCKVLDDDEPPTTSGTGGDAVAEIGACAEILELVLEDGCPPSSYPQVHYDGGSSTVLRLDDPSVAAELELGMLIQFGVRSGADWVGYNIIQNGDCTAGCFVPGCATGNYGCYATYADGNLCSFWCDSIEDADACTDLSATCLGVDSDGGLDDTGGGVAPYDCDDWRPESVQSSGGIHVVPRSLVDTLAREDAEALIECDGLRLRQGPEGYWSISKMADSGILGRLGLQLGDELRSFDGVSLDSFDGAIKAMDDIVGDDGPFLLRVRRRHADVDVRFRVSAAPRGE